LPKPTALKRLSGTYRADRAPKGLVAEVEPAVPPCPSFLGVEAQNEWNRLAPELCATGLLSQRDQVPFAALCLVVARVAEAETKVQETGAVITTPSGQQQKNPWLSILDQQLRQLDRWASHFGLSPASRSRVSVDQAAVKRAPNPWAAIAGEQSPLERLRAARRAANTVG
jgi:P27 family predicted phage terminase small subunit